MLKKILIAMAWALLAFPAGQAVAQTGTVAGTVTDSTTGEPLPGVNVVVEGTQLGTASGVDGEFNIAGVPVGDQTLVTSFIGYRTSQTPVTVSEGEVTEISIDLAPQVVGLEDVVVTALGIERQERSLGYAVAEVEGEELAAVPETNFISSLAGRIPGANFYSSNAMGGSARIVLRGPGSVAGNNQPLIVVDGIPINNETFTALGQAYGGGGYDYGNAAQILNPANIQSVTVLKGPSAAALYGSRGANGVIQVTTKDGSGLQEGIGVTVNTSLMTNRVYGLPNYQNLYGGGNGPFSTLDGDLIQSGADDHYIPAYAFDQSWGPRLDGTLARQWYSWDEVNGLMGQPTPWVAHPDNISNFYRTGLSSNTTVSFAQGADNFNYRAAVSNVTERGAAPNANLGRINLSFNGGLDLSDRLRTTVIAKYFDINIDGNPITGYSGVNVQFNHFGQRQVALGPDSYMWDYRRADGAHRSWNWTGVPGARAGGGANIIYANNPYWDRFENVSSSDTERLIGKFGIAYDLIENLTLGGEVSTDYYLERRQRRVAVGSSRSGNAVVGDYTQDLYEVQETSGQARLDYDQQLTQDFSLQVFGATEYRYETFDRNFGSAAGGLSAAGVYTLENSVSRPSIIDQFEEKGVFSLYGALNLGWRDLLYVDFTARNDWSSTLPDGENSYFYPSVASSFVFSALPALQGSDVLSFGKLRLSWARVGNDTGPYQLALTYPLGTPFAGSPVQSLPSSLPNAELVPEITTGWEVGTQLQFFNNRIGLDATYYSESTRNQILSVDVSGATGFAQTVINAGEIANQGVELALRFTPVLTEAVQWDVNVNWAKNVNEVVALTEGVDAFTIGPSVFGPDIQARVGEPYGTFYGTDFVYDANGNIVMDGGAYESSAPTVLGSYLPDWTGGLSSTLSYRGFTASVMLNGQKGGDIYSLSNVWGHYSGMFEDTAADEVRQLGVIPDAVYFPDGEPEDGYGSAAGTPVDYRVSARAYFTNWYAGPRAMVIYDASYIKLREATLGYTLPQELLAGTFVNQLTISLIGRNLATLFKNTPNFDPSIALSATNLQGIESGPLPPKRSYGISLRMGL